MGIQDIKRDCFLPVNWFSKALHLNPAISTPKMRGINGADVFIYFKPLITKQIRQNRSSLKAKKMKKSFHLIGE